MSELLGVVRARAWLHWRKAAQRDLQACKTRPLLSQDQVAVMRPGETVLVMPSLNGMTLDQQTRLIDSIKQVADRAKELGIEFIVIPDWGHKAIVVARESALPERTDDEATRKVTAQWLAQAMNKMHERDQAALAGLRSRTETIRKS